MLYEEWIYKKKHLVAVNRRSLLTIIPCMMTMTGGPRNRGTYLTRNSKAAPNHRKDQVREVSYSSRSRRPYRHQAVHAVLLSRPDLGHIQFSYDLPGIQLVYRIL